MIVKQDIWCIYFQTCIGNGFNAPEPADHHSVCISWSRQAGQSISSLCTSAVGWQVLEGRGRLWGTEGAGGGWGGVMSCCNNKQILMIYYKSAAEASAWGDWGGWQLLTHTPRKCLADDVCALRIINHWAHTLAYAHKCTFTKTCFQHTYAGVPASHTHMCGHTHVPCC